MQTIKFRAWDNDDKVMCEVVGLEFEKSELIKVEILFPTHKVGSLRYPKMVKLMQFTGCFDKNGKEIYEGDLVKISRETKWADDWIKDKEGVAQIQWIEEGCEYWVNFANDKFLVLRGKEWSSSVTEIEANELEVIGNKYENRELLK